MKHIQADIVTRLESIVKVYPFDIPKDASYPCARLTLLSDNTPYTLGKDMPKRRRKRYQLDVFGDDPATCVETLYDAITQLRTWTTNHVTPIQDSGSDNKTDGVYRYSQDFYISYSDNVDYPACASGVCWFNSKENVYSDVSGTVPATYGEGVGSWRSIGGDYTTKLATQATANARPQYTSQGIKPDGTNDYFDITQFNLTGALTIYIVADGIPQSVEPYANISWLGQHGASYPYGAIQYSKLNFGSGWYPIIRYENGGSNSVTVWNHADRKYIIRIRRNSSNQWRYTVTGVSEQLGGTQSGTVSFKYIFYGLSPTQVPHAGLWLKQLVIVNEDAVTTGLDTSIREKLFELEGINL